MPKISAAVGKSQANIRGDVATVQSLLNRSALMPGGHKLVHDGICGRATQKAIDDYQKAVLKTGTPDGVIMPEGPTMRFLATHSRPPARRQTRPNRHPASVPPDKPATTVNPQSPTLPLAGQDKSSLSQDDFVEAAHRLHCEPAAIRAIAQTETGSEGAFDHQGRPSILFERHLFHRLTQGRFDKTDPDISNPVQGGYGRFAEQYGKLERAMKLDHSAALSAASWGKFQILGQNYKQAGYSSVDAFVDAAKRSVQDQLAALVSFIQANPAMLRALQNRDWAGFTRAYNGPNYAENTYDSKMRASYETFSRSS